jgi:hypothetical protein
MALAATPLIPNDGALDFESGDGVPLAFTLNYEDGDVAFSEISESQKEYELFFHRGRFYGARKTQDKPVEVTFSCHAVGFTDAAQATMLDIVRRGGLWLASTSTLPASAGDLHCTRLRWRGERTTFGASADSSVIMKYVHLTAAFAEGIPGKWTIKGILLPYSTDYLAWT